MYVSNQSVCDVNVERDFRSSLLFVWVAVALETLWASARFVGRLTQKRPSLQVNGLILTHLVNRESSWTRHTCR